MSTSIPTSSSPLHSSSIPEAKTSSAPSEQATSKFQGTPVALVRNNRFQPSNDINIIPSGTVSKGIDFWSNLTPYLDLTKIYPETDAIPGTEHDSAPSNDNDIDLTKIYPENDAIPSETDAISGTEHDVVKEAKNENNTQIVNKNKLLHKKMIKELKQNFLEDEINNSCWKDVPDDTQIVKNKLLHKKVIKELKQNFLEDEINNSYWKDVPGDTPQNSNIS